MIFSTLITDNKNIAYIYLEALHFFVIFGEYSDYMKELNKELTTLLLAFNTNDFKTFKDFIISPFFYKEIKLKQSQGQLLALLSFFQKNQSNPEALVRQKLYKILFPDDTPEKAETKLNRVMTELLGLAKRFIYWNSLQKDSKLAFNEKLALSQFYFERNIQGYFEKTYDEAQDILQKTYLEQGNDYYYNQFVFELLKGKYLATTDINKGDLNILDVLEKLNTFYTLNFLELFSHFKNRQKVVKSNIVTPIVLEKLEESVLYFVNNTNSPPALLTSYKRILELVKQTEPNRADILSFESFLETYRAEIPTENYLNLLAYIRNFWNYRYTLCPNDETLLDLFEVYKRHWRDGHSDNLWQRYGNMLPNVILNMVTLGLKLHKSSNPDRKKTVYSNWVLAFLTKISTIHFKKNSYERDIIELCWANYYLNLKDYKNAEKAALYMKYKDPYTASFAAFILIEIHYYNSPDKYDGTLLNFRVWLHRQEGLPSDKKEFIREQLKKKLDAFE